MTRAEIVSAGHGWGGPDTDTRSVSEALSGPLSRSEPVSTKPLTRRQAQVLRLLADGERMTAIGERLGISRATVKFHAEAAYRRLGVASCPAAIDRANRLGLLRGPLPGAPLPEQLDALASRVTRHDVHLASQLRGLARRLRSGDTP